jgi:release factor glutamine methyltransferase
MFGALKKLRQRLAAHAVKLVQRFGPHTVEVMGGTYVVCQDVFNPKYYLTSEFMARHIRVRPQDAVLDVGTGSGIQAITAGRVARKVVAVDINPQAVRCARENAARNGVQASVQVLEGDLFSPLPAGDRFDVILFTPPYFEGSLTRPIDHALYDPGKAVARRFLTGARERLAPGGYVQMVYSSAAEPERVLEIAKELGWRVSVLAEKKALFETFSIYKLSLGA